MKRLIRYILLHFSLRLALLILLIVASVLSVTMGLLFYQTKQYVHQSAVDYANQVLDETVFNISGIIERTEQATLNTERRASSNLNPDSLMAYTKQMLEENPVLQGFTIALEPGIIEGRERFTTYSYRKPDSIYSMIKDDYEYTNDYWYKTPIEKKKDLWLDPYEYTVPGIDTKPRYYFSYTAPLYGPDGRLAGVVCSDLSMFWLSMAFSGVKPFPNSSAIMLSHNGSYIVHPDTLKLVKESIFSDPAPQAKQDVIRLGRSMISGQSGSWSMIVDGQPAHLFYRPMPHTGWSTAIVCPDSDVFDSYYHMLYIGWCIILFFLLMLLLICYLIIHKAVGPINLLAESARNMADRRFNENEQNVDGRPALALTYSKRIDTIGQLQNSFVQMQKSLNNHICELRRMNAEMEQRNKDLQHAYQQVREADERKIFFIQNMSHQVRTPLNIVTGFTQVITSSYSDMSETELNEIFDHMKSSIGVINRIIRMLIATSNSDTHSNVNNTDVVCNDLCREVVAAAIKKMSAFVVSSGRTEVLSISVDSAVPDDFIIRTDRQAVASILTELVDNAIRFTPKGSIVVACHQQDENTTSFTVTDTGPGIAPEIRDNIFTPFFKPDSFTEGIGLGLPLSRHTAQVLGGELTLDEEYTDGTRFLLTLPLTVDN